MDSINGRLCAKLTEMSKETFLAVVEGAKDYAMYKGIGMRELSLSDAANVHLPFCLVPSEFPGEWFLHVHSLQASINLVLHKLSYSKEILEACLKNTIESDEFTRNIYNIYKKVYDSQKEQVSLGFIRSDYLLTCDSLIGRTNGIKQVENNTIAVGFGGISPMLKYLYRHVLQKLEGSDYHYNLPDNESCDRMAKAMIAAYYAYGKLGAVILFVVEESTYNIFDQRLLEYEILENDETLEVLRCSFKDLRTCLELKDERIYVNKKEVAVVYYRVGYAPEHYKPEDWTTRLLIEQSQAIKCPSVGLHLAGTKRVQLFLSQEGFLEKFVEPEVAKKLRKVFAHQYALDTDNRIISKAIMKYDDFVLKPEREGGGNNLYGRDIKSFLESSDVEKRKSFILMEKINPPAVPNCIIRHDRKPEFCSVNSELGIYGVILGNGDHVCRNEAVGHLLRSKPVKLNEGGVSSGCGALDYPSLVYSKLSHLM